MEKKISLDLAQNIYYFHVPAAAHKALFSSVFAIDQLLLILLKDDRIDLHGYCFFDHSLHIVVKCHDKPSLWLEPFLMRYNQWHQSTSGDSGYLFNDLSTRTILVQPKQLPKVIRYLHQLPMLKKIASTASQYLYSSYHEYLKPLPNDLIKDPLVLTLLSPHSGQRIRRYQNYMDQRISHTELRHMLEGNLPFHFAIAEDGFLTRVMTQYELNREEIGHQELNDLWQRCVDTLSRLIHLDESTVLGKSRHHSMPDAHHLLAWLFVNVAKGPTKYAAKWLSVDEETLQLNIRSVQLHHPSSFLRYIIEHWGQQSIAR